MRALIFDYHMFFRCLLENEGTIINQYFWLMFHNSVTNDVTTSQAQLQGANQIEVEKKRN